MRYWLQPPHRDERLRPLVLRCHVRRWLPAAASCPEHMARHAGVDATTGEIEVMDGAEYLARFELD